MPSEFVHLHVHTEFSLLDGQSRISELVDRAKALEMPAVGISDHGVMFGVIDFFRKASGAGVKPIIGMEAYLAPRNMQDKDPQRDKRPYHLLLWAKNQVGYQNLLKIASASQLEGYYYRPRIDRDFLARHAEGIIATSGCLASQIPRAVEDAGDKEARELIGWYQEVFGSENFFLELQPHEIPELHRLNEWLVNYRKSNHTPVQLLASNDMHYVRYEDTDSHDTLLCIQTNALKRQTDRMQLTPLGSYYMKSAEEMRQSFMGLEAEWIQEAFDNTLKVADMCNVDLKSKGYHLPRFPVPEGMSEGDYLRFLCDIGMKWRFDTRAEEPELRERLERELSIIGTMGFNTYFLIVWDLCEFARSADIWWNVRGSGAGSLVAYCLGITNLDPIQNSLLFERFLNPGRVSMPDIDLDYPDDRRGEMIAYAVQKYGEDKVAAIITFGTMGAKAAVRDVARAMDMPLSKVNQVVKLIPQEAKQKPIKEYVESDPDLTRLYHEDDEIRKVIDTAIDLQGLTRHASTHAAGVIIADNPLVDYIPLHRITGTDPSGGALKSVTQFPMETAESIGLLKVDFLGLSTLTILRKACELVEKHHKIRYTMDNIPYRHDDDKISDDERAKLTEAFKMLGRGDTVGVFQVESSGMQSMLRDMRPFKFEHIIAGISLYRPGPMDFIPQFNRRMHGQEETQYHHPYLERILGETYGICLAGDTLIYEARTGQHERLDSLEGREGNFWVQSVTESQEPVASVLKRWWYNGVRPVFELQLAYGATITATADHQFLTPEGWKPLKELTEKGVIATPRHLIEPQEKTSYPHEDLRVLARLVGEDGQHNPDALIPSPVFSLANADISTFLAFLWDSHGIIWQGTGHYEAVSFSLARELQSLLLRLGIASELSVRTGGTLQSVETVYRVFIQDINDLTRFSERTFFEGGVHWSPILSITPLGEQPVYDIEVEGTHNFVANGMIVHNCVYQEQIMQIAGEMFGYELGEADLMRRAVSKKKEKDLLQHRQIFEERAPQNNISVEVANKIFDDIVFFANYGFNKSHASDYAVITVQTAYLKCHYPEEYMTALLTVQFDDSAKVATFLEECRRLHIPVLPPDVNYSHIEFDIETMPDGKRGIRFGMSAIKNVGQAGLKHLIEMRDSGGRFKHLTDFAQRVDLRILGKRALESLIQVGALDSFGRRDELFASSERLMSFSTKHHKAKDTKQASLFGEAFESEEMFTLLKLEQALPQREMLQWERELLGLYVTGRPVDRYKAQLSTLPNLVEVVTLRDPENPSSARPVQIAGEIVAVRRQLTQKQDQMMILTLEDWHETAGMIDLVLFPKTMIKLMGDYQAETGRPLDVGEIVLVRGKFEPDRTQILPDNITSNFEVFAPQAPTTIYRDEMPTWMNDAENSSTTTSMMPPSMSVSPPPMPIAETLAPLVDPEWVTAPHVAQPSESLFDEEEDVVQSRHLTIHFYPNGDETKDAIRLRRVLNALKEHPGNDTFILWVYSTHSRKRYVFPDFTFGYSEKLTEKLKLISGITYDIT